MILNNSKKTSKCVFKARTTQECFNLYFLRACLKAEYKYSSQPDDTQPDSFSGTQDLWEDSAMKMRPELPRTCIDEGQLLAWEYSMDL